MFKSEPVHDDVKKDRQMWFWRRITLQGTLIALILMLGHSSFVTAKLQNDWPTVVNQLGLIGAIVFLVSIYFAMVNDADKISRFVGSVGNAIGDARHGDSNNKVGQ